MSVKLILTEHQLAILQRLSVREDIGLALALPILVLDAEGAEIVSDALSDELARVGFDRDYELTPEGQIIEDLIDRLFIP